jgi:predicted nucleic acid-binding protein
MLFVDASAFVKRYVRERHSVTVRRLVAAGPVAVSRLSEVEVPSALVCLVRERRLSVRSRDRVIAALLTDVAAWHVIEITAEGRRWRARCTGTNEIRLSQSRDGGMFE